VGLRSRFETLPVAAGVQVASFLLVTCGPTHLAMPAGIVRGIVRLDHNRLNAALAVLGVRSSVIDLAELFGLSPSRSAESRIVVCGMQSTRQAFSVGSVLGLEDIETTKITELLPHFVGPERQWFTGMFLFRETVALIIGADWLLSIDHHRYASPDRQPIPGTLQRLAADVSGVSAGMIGATPEAHCTQSDIIDLEEATNADHLPWAEL
jgi:chemotaxis signal transduction protein